MSFYLTSISAPFVTTLAASAAASETNTENSPYNLNYTEEQLSTLHTKIDTESSHELADFEWYTEQIDGLKGEFVTNGKGTEETFESLKNEVLSLIKIYNRDVDKGRSGEEQAAKYKKLIISNFKYFINTVAFIKVNLIPKQLNEKLEKINEKTEEIKEKGYSKEYENLINNFNENVQTNTHFRVLSYWLKEAELIKVLYSTIHQESRNDISKEWLLEYLDKQTWIIQGNYLSLKEKEASINQLNEDNKNLSTENADLKEKISNLESALAQKDKEL
ncbi:hypothetical protein [Mycoplasmopsis gallinacea]|uniref:Uncharacterized protein n=1 Tax=Mycoplasmopsis gallinacea TaxID=29556 RepID=A0A6H0V303_9BACT|nr:hypothetical protein [Mycoplasmopsis gallinacea]QIW62114.1 hypothetical protein GOQ20_01470 [Mycoplasmopsis gallinacea]